MILPEEIGAGLKEEQLTIITVNVGNARDSTLVILMRKRTDLCRGVVGEGTVTSSYFIQYRTLCVHSIKAAHDERQPALSGDRTCKTEGLT